MSETLSAPIAAPVAAPLPVPVETAPTPAPVLAAPVPAPEPIAAPAPVAEAPAPTTLLGEIPPPPPVEPAPAPEAPIVEGQSVEPAPPPTFEPFTLPEGSSVQPERLAEFTNLLGSFEGETKADHAKVQQFGQQLMDRHVAEVQRAVGEVHQANLASFESQKTTWKDQFLADPEIGGNAFQTTVDSAMDFIRTHGGTDAQQDEFRQLMNTSGIGNHPAMIRILARAGRGMSEGRPLAAQPAPLPRSKTQKLYGGG